MPKKPLNAYTHTHTHTHTHARTHARDKSGTAEGRRPPNPVSGRVT